MRSRVARTAAVAGHDGALASSPPVVSSSDSAAAAEQRHVLLPSLAMLLAGHILRDGEVVLLILKPSRWSILFAVMPFAVLVAIGAGAAGLCSYEPRSQYLIVEAAIVLLAARVMLATLVWMSRLYVMTDYRILRLSGVFTVEIFDCPLRRVGHTRVFASVRERLWALGSIEIQPATDTTRGEPAPPGVWQTIRKPAEVHERICAAINRAKGCGQG